MRFACWITIAALGLASVASSTAQTRQDVERCRSINDGLRRLSCYDGIALSQPPANRGRYETVALAELKDFALNFRGRFIEVTGWVSPGADLFQLKTDDDDPDSLPVDVRSLDRQQRQAFMEQCGGGCDATIQGRVGPVGFTTGIAADLIIALGT